MRAAFIFNSWTQNIAPYDLVVCAANYDPETIRARPDYKPGAKLAAYVNFETHHPGRDKDSVDGKIWRALSSDVKNLLAWRPMGLPVPSVLAWPLVDLGAMKVRAFSSEPWPKFVGNIGQSQIDLALTFERIDIHVAAIAENLKPGWDLIYVDQCTPLPRWLYDRYVVNGVLSNDTFGKWSSLRESLWAYAISQLKRHPAVDVEIIGNTTGHIFLELDGICAEPERPVDKLEDEMLRTACFVEAKSTIGATTNVDWSGKAEAAGLVYRGEFLP